MKLTPEQLAKWNEAATSKVPFHGRLETLCEAVPALIAELEEATAARGNSVLVPAPKLEAMQAEITALRKRLAEAQAFIKSISEQRPEKPDHWSSCGQCEGNSSSADDFLSGDTSALQFAIAEAVEPYRKDAACWQFARKELCWREEGKKQIRWTMILRMPKPNIGIEVLSEGSIAKELDAAVLAAIAAKGGKL